MFQNDLKIKISTGSSRRSKTWLKQEMYWSDFVEKLEHPIRTEETLAEYMGYRKAKQDEIKDVGGFVGGELSGEQRRNVLFHDHRLAMKRHLPSHIEPRFSVHSLL